MVWKKALTLVFGLLMLALPATFGGVSAASTVGSSEPVVVLVSDNPADSALAEFLANGTGAVVVTTTWGVYDPNVTAEIMAYSPSKVIIVGGPMAVVDDYVSDLKDLGVPVERWWGKNRYETDMAFIRNASVEFGLKFDFSAAAPGNDTVAIQRALELAVKNRGVVLYLNGTTNVSTLAKKLHLRNVTVVVSPASRGWMKKLPCGCPVESTNVTEREVERLLLRMEHRLHALYTVANATGNPELLREAESFNATLTKAENAFNAGNYTAAYSILLKLQERTQFGLRIVGEVMRAKVAHNETAMLNRQLMKIEFQLEVLHRAGVSIPGVDTMISQLQAAIKNGQYGLARELIHEIEKAIREAYRENRDSLRNHWISHPHRGGSHR